MNDIELEIMERMLVVPASIMSGGLDDTVAWKDALKDSKKLLGKSHKTESELTSMLARLNRLAGNV